ncbi:hypothetical protein GQ600_9775 [Phytophthora cactorum]|nr:hypothetical protein GQ600_9775 [Phytophthora cactorum]
MTHLYVNPVRVATCNALFATCSVMHFDPHFAICALGLKTSRRSPGQKNACPISLLWSDFSCIDYYLRKRRLDLSVEHLPRKLVGDYHDTKQSLRLRDFTEETEIEPEYEERGGFEKLGDLITKVDNATGMTGKLGDVVGRRRSLR